MRKLIVKWALKKAITNQIRMDNLLEKMVKHKDKTDFIYRTMQSMIRAYNRRIEFYSGIMDLFLVKKK